MLCPKCKQDKTPEEFNIFVGRRTKHCTACLKKQQSYGHKYHNKTGEPYPHSREKTLRSYGITIQQYEEMEAAQEGKCAICKEPRSEKRRLHTDHCHATQKVRGLLCTRCNLGLGQFNDKPELLRAAATYLEMTS